MQPELKSWKHNAICTFLENVAEKRSNNKLKSWSNIRCSVRAEGWNNYKKTERQKNSEKQEKKLKSRTVYLNGHLEIFKALESVF